VAQRRRSGSLTPPTRQWPENSFDAEDFWHPTTPVTSHAPNRPTRLREVRCQTATSRPLRVASGGDSSRYSCGKHSLNISDKSDSSSVFRTALRHSGCPRERPTGQRVTSIHVSYGVQGFSHLFPVGLCQIRVRNVSGSVSTGSWLIARDGVTHPRRRNGVSGSPWVRQSGLSDYSGKPANDEPPGR
jgi:hypothetical protein